MATMLSQKPRHEAAPQLERQVMHIKVMISTECMQVVACQLFWQTESLGAL